MTPLIEAEEKGQGLWGRSPIDATDGLGVIGRETSFELAYADDMRRGNQFRIGGKMDNGEIDVSYQWDESGIWALQATRK